MGLPCPTRSCALSASQISTTGDVLPLLMEQQHARVHPASLKQATPTSLRVTHQATKPVLTGDDKDVKTMVPLLPDVACSRQ